jgi:hypothetical protein
VALKSPNGKDWSVVLETIDAAHPQSVEFKVSGGLSASTVHIWETNDKRTFEHVADLPVRNGAFNFAFEPDSLYSLTTTTGQGKGTVAPPPQSSFPLPYRDGFEHTPLHRAPHFLSDQDGAFEVADCLGHSGQCLEQVITEKPIPWGPLPDPWTLAGDASWTNYQVEADVRLEDRGSAMLIGRIDSADVFQDDKAPLPSGYVFRIYDSGNWELLSTAYKKPTKTLAHGNVALASGKWRHLRLICNGRQIAARFDDHALASVEDSDHARGMFGIGTGWNRAQFDNLSVTHP